MLIFVIELNVAACSGVVRFGVIFQMVGTQSSSLIVHIHITIGNYGVACPSLLLSLERHGPLRLRALIGSRGGSRLRRHGLAGRYLCSGILCWRCLSANSND